MGLRGTVDPGFGLMKRHAEEMASILRSAGLAGMPVGVDIVEPPMMFELEKAGLKVKDGQQVMLEAREVKSADEIALLNRAAAMVDGAYDLINEKLQARRARKRHRRDGERVSLSATAPTTWKQSTPFPANAAIRIRTISPTV